MGILANTREIYIILRSTHSACCVLFSEKEGRSLLSFNAKGLMTPAPSFQSKNSETLCHCEGELSCTRGQPDLSRHAGRETEGRTRREAATVTFSTEMWPFKAVRLRQLRRTV